MRKDLYRLGLSEYEARAYLSLLTEGPLTATELCSRAGIPRSKVYEVLRRLAEKGWVNPGDGRPARYSARHPREAIYIWRSIREREIRKYEEEALEELERLSAAVQEREDILMIMGLEAAVSTIARMLEQCDEEVFLALPPELTEGLDDLLRPMRGRGSKASVLAPSDEVALRVLEELPGALVRVKDDMFGGGAICGTSEVALLLGRGRAGGQYLTIKADHPGLAALAKNYFEHLWSLSRGVAAGGPRNG
ncbi:MAG: helix-turn-helix domain-containing protein [Nitrososphaeria archaeon]